MRRVGGSRLRLTLQATQRNKFNIYWDEQSPCNGSAYFGGEGCREQPESGAVVGPLGLGGLSSTTSLDANSNFVVDCNLFNQAAQDLRPVGGDNCGVGNSRFGTLNPAETYDEKLLNGWFVRPDDWGFAASVQQEVLPRVSVEAQYTRRWLSGFSAEDNRASGSTSTTW